MSPPPPLRHYAAPPTLPPPKVTEDTPPDLLEGDMDLTVILPAGHRVNMSVARSTPMMDLLIQVTTAHKINPGGHIIHLVSDNRLLTYKPSTPIGTLDTSVIKIVAKNKLNEEAKARRAHLVSQAQEKNIRLKVNLPRNQLAVYRVPPRTLISEVLTMVCVDRGIEADTHEIRHPVNVDEKLRGSCTLADYQLQEVTVVPRDYQPPPLSVTDLITMAAITSNSREQADSKRRGLLSLFSRRAKSSAGESSLSSGSAGERSVSPARSDGSTEGGGGGGGQHPTLTPASSTTTITPATAPPLPRPRKRQAPPPPPPGAEANGKESQRGGGGGGGAPVPLSRCSSDSSSGYHESIRSAHTSPAESEVSEVTHRPPLTPLTNLTSTSSSSSLSLASRGKRRAPPPPKALPTPPHPIPEEGETPPTPQPTTSTPVKAPSPPSPSPSSSSSSSSSSSFSSDGRKTTGAALPPPPDVDAPPPPPSLPSSSSSSSASSSAPSGSLNHTLNHSSSTYPPQPPPHSTTTASTTPSTFPSSSSGGNTEWWRNGAAQTPNTTSTPTSHRVASGGGVGGSGVDFATQERNWGGKMPQDVKVPQIAPRKRKEAPGIPQNPLLLPQDGLVTPDPQQTVPQMPPAPVAMPRRTQTSGASDRHQNHNKNSFKTQKEAKMWTNNGNPRKVKENRTGRDENGQKVSRYDSSNSNSVSSRGSADSRSSIPTFRMVTQTQTKISANRGESRAFLADGRSQGPDGEGNDGSRKGRGSGKQHKALGSLGKMFGRSNKSDHAFESFGKASGQSVSDCQSFPSADSDDSDLELNEEMFEPRYLLGEAFVNDDLTFTPERTPGRYPSPPSSPSPPPQAPPRALPGRKRAPHPPTAPSKADTPSEPKRAHVNAFQDSSPVLLDTATYLGSQDYMHSDPSPAPPSTPIEENLEKNYLHDVSKLQEIDLELLSLLSEAGVDSSPSLSRQASDASTKIAVMQAKGSATVPPRTNSAKDQASKTVPDIKYTSITVPLKDQASKTVPDINHTSSTVPLKPQTSKTVPSEDHTSKSQSQSTTAEGQRVPPSAAVPCQTSASSYRSGYLAMMSQLHPQEEHLALPPSGAATVPPEGSARVPRSARMVRQNAVITTSSHSSLCSDSEHEIQTRRASFSSESSEAKSGQGDGDEHSSDDDDGSSTSSSTAPDSDDEEEKPDAKFEDNRITKFSDRSNVESETTLDQVPAILSLGEKDEGGGGGGRRSRDASPSTSSSSCSSSCSSSSESEQEEEKGENITIDDGIPWDFPLPDPPTPFQDVPRSPEGARDSAVPSQTVPVDVGNAVPSVRVPEGDIASDMKQTKTAHMEDSHRRRRRRRRRHDSCSSSSSSTSSTSPSAPEEVEGATGKEEIKRNMINELKTAIRDTRTEPRIIEMRPKATVVYESRAASVATVPASVTPVPTPASTVSATPPSTHHRTTHKRIESTSTYESCEEGHGLLRSSSSSVTSYDSAPPPLPDTPAPPPSIDTPPEEPHTQGTRAGGRGKAVYRPPAINFSISTYTSRSEETSYDKKVVKTDSFTQDSTSTASTTASTTVLTTPTPTIAHSTGPTTVQTAAISTAKPVLPEKPFFKEFSSNSRFAHGPPRWIPRVSDGERRPLTFRHPAAPRRVQRGGSQLGRASSLGNLSVLERDLRRAQSSSDLSFGNAGRGAPVDMQGGGGGSNNGGGGGVGGGPPFFPMAGGAGPGGGMMLGDAGLADEFMKLQQDFFKWQQQLLQNQHVLHSRVAPLATNPPQLQSVGVIRDILGQAPQGPPNGPPPPHQQVAEAHNPAVSVGAAVGGRRAPVERIINIRFEDGPSETDEAELHGPAFSRIGPVHDLSRDMAQMTTGMPAPRPAAPPPIQQQQQQPAPQRRWEEPNVSVGAWQDRPSTQAPLQQQQEAPTYPPMPSPTPLTPSQPLVQPFAQQRMSPRPQGPRGYSKPTEGALQWPPSTSSSTPSAQQEFQALPPEQKQQFAQFMQQQRQQPTWPPQQPQQQQQQPYQPQPLQEQHKQVFVQQQQPTWTSPQPQQAPQQPPQQATWPPKQPSPQPQQPSQQPSQPPQQATWPSKQVSPQPVTARQLQQPAQQAEWPPKQPSPQPGTARQPQQPDSTVFWKELEDRRQGLGLGQEGQEQEGGAEPARPPRRGSRQDSPPQDATRPQYYFNGESTPSATPAGANAGPRYTSVVTVAADQPQEAGRDKVRSVVQLNAEQQPQQSQQAQRPAPVVRGFRQPTEEGVQSRIIANQAASRSRSSVSPPSATNGSEAQTVARIVPSATSTASTTPPQRTTPPRSSPTQSFPAVQLRPVQNRVSPPTEVPQPPPAAAGPPPPPPPAPPMAPPPPPAPTMPQGERRTATGKKIVTCKGGPELDAREELMMAIRSHGGMKSLRRTHPPV